MKDKRGPAPDAYSDPALIAPMLKEIRRKADAIGREIRLMEVCGTHTMAIFKNGIPSLLPENISLLSGPGCPVCVTDTGEIDAFIALARREDVIVATFGDLMRVPGSDSSLQKERAAGRDARMVYSTFDAVELAARNPDRTVVFLGVGFETTAPTVAAAILMARERGLENFAVLSAHKRVAPALFALMAGGTAPRIDGFLLPGHVSVIIGVSAYQPFFEAYPIPCAVAGFEPADILGAALELIRQIEDDAPALVNCYGRAVSAEGNRRAMAVMDTVFEAADARWRGLGPIPESGLAIREEFAAFDAARRFGIRPRSVPEPPGCRCGVILTGAGRPTDCPLFGKSCSPTRPVGPCMVSSEGTCAAYYRYHGHESHGPESHGHESHGTDSHETDSHETDSDDTDSHETESHETDSHGHEPAGPTGTDLS